MNEIRVLHTLNSSTQEEVKENKDVESESHTGKIEAQLKKNRFESLKNDISSLQDPHFHGFNSSPKNYFIPKIDMSMFNANYPLAWILKMEQFFQTMMKHIRNQSVMEYLIKWKKLPIKYSIWEEFFIQKCPQLLKHWSQCLFEGKRHVKP